MHNHLDRNLIGYGPNPPDAQWPGDARIAVSFVLNYEEGGENTILNGDPASEVFLTETPGGTPIEGGRDLSTESMYEYGSRAGFWRILRLFQERNMRFTSWAVGRALELNPAAGKAMAEAGHEVASHGWRWINYKDFTLEQELDHMRQAVKVIEQTAGRAPVGWYTGRFGARAQDDVDRLALPPRRAAEPGRDPGALFGVCGVEAQGLGRHARGDRAALDRDASGGQSLIRGGAVTIETRKDSRPGCAAERRTRAAKAMRTPLSPAGRHFIDVGPGSIAPALSLQIPPGRSAGGVYPGDKFV